MKITGVTVLLFLCCLCVAFTGGLFIGRNFNHTQIQISENLSGNLPDSNENQKQDALININTATAKELEALPGIGEALSLRIVAYREEHGNFSSVADLLNVTGIGQGKLEAIMYLITVGN